MEIGGGAAAQPSAPGSDTGREVPDMPREFLRDKAGRRIGWVDSTAGKKTVFDSTGKQIGWVDREGAHDATGRIVGKGIGVLLSALASPSLG